MANKSNIAKALTMEFGEAVTNRFITYCTEEDFDEETIDSDVKDAKDDVEQCSFVSDLAEHFVDKFKSMEDKTDLLKLMFEALDGKFRQGSNNHFVDPYTVEWRTTRKDVKNTKLLLDKICPLMKNDQDTALLDVLTASQKQRMPLLTWLSDTRTRYRVNHFILKNCDIQQGNWLREYAYFKRLTNSASNKLVDKLNSSIQSAEKRLFGSIQLPNMTYLVDDDINQFAQYVITMHDVIGRLLADNKNQITPLQIDMWIIPKNVASAMPAADDGKDDSDEDGADDDPENDDPLHDMIGNIEERLKSNKVKYEKFAGMAPEKMSRQLTEHLVQRINDKRNKRIVIYADRRNPKHASMKPQIMAKFVKNGHSLDDDEKRKEQRQQKKNWQDTIYVVEPPQYGTIPKEHTPESAFWATMEYMMPTMKGETGAGGRPAYGCRNTFNGSQFTLSFHIESADVIRCYWFFSAWGMRLLPSDCYLLWPSFFKHAKLDAAIKSKLQKLKPVQDNRFVQWYEKTTNQSLVLKNM